MHFFPASFTMCICYLTKMFLLEFVMWTLNLESPLTPPPLDFL